MGDKFIMHSIISLGILETEVDLTRHISLLYDLRHFKIIGIDEDKESLKKYSILLLWSFIEERLMYYPNVFREIDGFIINSAQIFDYEIINDSTAIPDMPSVLHTESF